jgi:Fe-Mn family superoxide dismutase
MPHQLSPLPYAYDALEPHYDEATLRIHHGKHHQKYVDTLNEALADHPRLASLSLEPLLKSLDQVPAAIRGKVANNAGGVWNHDFFWHCMAPGKGGAPAGKVAKAVDAAFGSFAGFQKKFKEAALGVFGSGWAYLVVADDGDLEIETYANQDCPVSRDRKALLTIDLWEHADYLKFQNRRPEWVDAWWNVVDWDAVNARLG